MHHACAEFGARRLDHTADSPPDKLAVEALRILGLGRPASECFVTRNNLGQRLILQVAFKVVEQVAARRRPNVEIHNIKIHEGWQTITTLKTGNSASRSISHSKSSPKLVLGAVWAAIRPIPHPDRKSVV